MFINSRDESVECAVLADGVGTASDGTLYCTIVTLLVQKTTTGTTLQ